MNIRHLTRTTLCFGAAILLALTACQKPPAEPTAPALQKVSLRLAWVYDMAEVGIFVAKDKGFYAKEGLDLEIKPGGFGLDPLKLVAAGSDTIGVGGGVNLLLAREKGLPLVAVAAEFQETPVGFVARKDSGIVNFPDFKGRKVGIQTGADTDTIYRALLAKFGMKSSDVKEVPIQFDPTPFVAGNIDVLPAYVSNQPITLKKQGIETTVITAASQGLSIYGNVYFVTESTLTKQSDMVNRFLRATRKGWEVALVSPESAIASLKARSKDYSDSELKEIHTAVAPFIQQPGGQLLGMTLQRWEATYQALIGAGLSQARKPTQDAFRQAER